MIKGPKRWCLPVDNIVYQYCVLRKTLPEIGSYYGVSRETIRERLEGIGVPRRLGGWIPGVLLPEETKRKISVTQKERIKRNGHPRGFLGKKHTEETKVKQSIAMTGENNPCYNKICSEKTRRKISEGNKGKEILEEHRKKISEGNKGKKRTEEFKVNRSKAMMGENNPNFNDWSSFKPYCHAFNDRLKEHIRNLCNRTCTICRKSILQYHKRHWKRMFRLHIDHTDENKMQGCDSWEWRLTPLCPTCHGKMQKQKFSWHLLLQLLLLKNKKHQINFLFGDEM